jgi:hypothetical protein
MTVSQCENLPLDLYIKMGVSSARIEDKQPPIRGSDNIWHDVASIARSVCGKSDMPQSHLLIVTYLLSFAAPLHKTLSLLFAN